MGGTAIRIARAPRKPALSRGLLQRRRHLQALPQPALWGDRLLRGVRQRAGQGLRHAPHEPHQGGAPARVCRSGGAVSSCSLACACMSPAGPSLPRCCTLHAAMLGPVPVRQVAGSVLDVLTCPSVSPAPALGTQEGLRACQDLLHRACSFALSCRWHARCGHLSVPSRRVVVCAGAGTQQGRAGALPDLRRQCCGGLL